MNEADLIVLLDKKHTCARFAFAATILERMLPVYAPFVQAEGFGDVAMARRGVDIVWEASRGTRPDLKELRALLPILDALAPDMDDYGDLRGALALDLITALLCALDAIANDPRGEVVAQVSTKVIDSIDMFVQLRDAPKLDRQELAAYISADPLMQRELQRQVFALGLLGVTAPSQAKLDELRRDAERSPAIETAAIEAYLAKIATC